jgi:hypothetical protein
LPKISTIIMVMSYDNCSLKFSKFLNDEMWIISFLTLSVVYEVVYKYKLSKKSKSIATK